MKKVLVLLVAVLCLTIVSNAQQKGNVITGGAVIALPMGDFGDGYDMGFGATATFEMPFGKQLVGFGEVGYIYFGGKSDGYSASVIPIMAGGKYFFDTKGGLYALGTAGFHLFTMNYELFGVSGDASETEFAIGVGGGYEVKVSKTMLLDISAKYMLISDANYLALRAALKFPLGK